SSWLISPQGWPAPPQPDRSIARPITDTVFFLCSKQADTMQLRTATNFLIRQYTTSCQVERPSLILKPTRCFDRDWSLKSEEVWQRVHPASNCPERKRYKAARQFRPARPSGI